MPRHERPLSLAALRATTSILNGFTINTKHCTLTSTPSQIS
jgi:hypothetical protein